MQSILQFMYLGEATVLQERIEEFMDLAKELHLKELEREFTDEEKFTRNKEVEVEDDEQDNINDIFKDVSSTMDEVKPFNKETYVDNNGFSSELNVGEKNYKCCDCGIGFKHKNNLLRHKQ